MSTKSRFTTSDVKAMVRDTRRYLGHRVANIYDLNDKTYLFKFAVPGESEKTILLLESGIRFHTTKFVRDKNDMPSPFAMKLRKHIRTKRMEDMRQIGDDRLVDFRFGSGESTVHVVLELYAQGNIILTDQHYEVLSLLRSHQFDADVAIRVGEIYPIGFAAASQAAAISCDDAAQDMNVNAFLAWTKIRLHDHMSFDSGAMGGSKKKVKMMALRQLLLSKDSGFSNYGVEIIDHFLLTHGLQPTMKVDVLLEQFDACNEPATEAPHIRSKLESLLLSLNTLAKPLLAQLDEPGQPGYIIYKDEPPSTSRSTSISDDTVAPMRVYIDFVPKLFAQHEGKLYLEFISFDAAADVYFCKSEEQKLHMSARTAEESAKRKVDNVKLEQQNLINSLSGQQKLMHLRGVLMEIYAEDIEKVMLVINSALGSGMPWKDIETMVKVETEKGNPYAGMISKLKLERNHIVLKLPNLMDDEDDKDDVQSNNGCKEEEDENTEDNVGAQAEQSGASLGRDAQPPVQSSKVRTKKDKLAEDISANKEKQRKKPKQGTLPTSGKKSNVPKESASDPIIEVEIDLAVSAYANAGRLYTHGKAASIKEAKTVEASIRAIQLVEDQSSKQLAAQQVKRSLLAVRKVHWFEKFNWFITSEGYMCLSGRDAQQNEQLVKRYLKPSDAYIHADIPGASSCILKSKKSVKAGDKDAPSSVGGHGASAGSSPLTMSPKALQEAGAMSVCRSAAWSNKVVTSAWWVWGTQVSKSAPSGEYLTTGSFMIYGKKNFLPPSPLEMGFGIMFRLDDSCVLHHLADRKDRVYDMESVYSSVQTAGAASTVDSTSTVGVKADEERYGVQYDAISGVPSTVGVVVSSEKIQKPKSKAQQQGQAQKKDAIMNVTSKSKQKGDKGKTDISRGSASSSAVVLPDQNAKKDKTLLTGNLKSTKKMSATEKKKARRYAEQDDEDRELAMRSLGHVHTGEIYGAEKREKDEQDRILDRIRRQEKVGISKTQQKTVADWKEQFEAFPIVFQEYMMKLVNDGVVKFSDLECSVELKALSNFPEEHFVIILNQFCEKVKINRMSNKNGILANLMRDFMKIKNDHAVTEAHANDVVVDRAVDVSEEPHSEVVPETDLAPATSATSVTSISSPGTESTVPETTPMDTVAGTVVEAPPTVSRRELKKQEQLEVNAILEEEGVLDEEEGKQAEDIDKLTGCPLRDDILLYPIPVCGPYSCMQNFKYKVKLIPGTGKKGKSCKQAIELFTRDKECTSQEKGLMKGLTDPEMVAIMIADVKMSMPGLHQRTKGKK